MARSVTRDAIQQQVVAYTGSQARRVRQQNAAVERLTQAPPQAVSGLRPSIVLRASQDAPSGSPVDLGRLHQSKGFSWPAGDALPGGAYGDALVLYVAFKSLAANGLSARYLPESLAQMCDIVDGCLLVHVRGRSQATRAPIAAAFESLITSCGGVSNAYSYELVFNSLHSPTRNTTASSESRSAVFLMANLLSEHVASSSQQRTRRQLSETRVMPPRSRRRVGAAADDDSTGEFEPRPRSYVASRAQEANDESPGESSPLVAAVAARFVDSDTHTMPLVIVVDCQSIETTSTDASDVFETTSSFVASLPVTVAVGGGSDVVYELLGVQCVTSTNVWISSGAAGGIRVHAPRVGPAGASIVGHAIYERYADANSETQNRCDVHVRGRSSRTVNHTVGQLLQRNRASRGVDGARDMLPLRVYYAQRQVVAQREIILEPESAVPLESAVPQRPAMSPGQSATLGGTIAPETLFSTVATPLFALQNGAVLCALNSSVQALASVSFDFVAHLADRIVANEWRAVITEHTRLAINGEVSCISAQSAAVLLGRMMRVGEYNSAHEVIEALLHSLPNEYKLRIEHSRTCRNVHCLQTTRDETSFATSIVDLQLRNENDSVAAALDSHLRVRETTQAAVHSDLPSSRTSCCNLAPQEQGGWVLRDQIALQDTARLLVVQMADSTARRMRTASQTTLAGWTLCAIVARRPGHFMCFGRRRWTLRERPASEATNGVDWFEFDCLNTSAVRRRNLEHVLQCLIESDLAPHVLVYERI